MYEMHLHRKSNGRCIVKTVYAIANRRAYEF
jgi:hypothetical protein